MLRRMVLIVSHTPLSLGYCHGYEWNRRLIFFLSFLVVIPWGRLNHPLRKDLVIGQKPEKEGGSGLAEKFWEWSEEQVKPYL